VEIVSIAFLVTSLAVCSVPGYLAYRRIETPMLARLKGIGQRRTLRPASAS
jgi:hypothetical protein